MYRNYIATKTQRHKGLFRLFPTLTNERAMEGLSSSLRVFEAGFVL